jgi:hypothetical protein
MSLERIAAAALELTPVDAMRGFRKLATPLRLRLCRDAEGWPVIPGKLGSIEWHHGVILAVHTDRPRMFSRILGIPGVRPWQVGDHELRALFSAEVLPTVAAVIQARRRRRPETAAHLRNASNPAYSGPSAA